MAAASQRVLAEDLQDVRQQGDARAKQVQHEVSPTQSSRSIFCGAVVRQVPVDEEQTEQADRQVDEEDEAPVRKKDLRSSLPRAGLSSGR